MNAQDGVKQESNPAVFVAGMSRSGSMWAYNVVRRLLGAAGMVPVPESVPPDAREITDEALCSQLKGKSVYCIKTHYSIQLDLEQVRIICTHRDVRDAMLSFMRFMHCSFKHGLEVAASMMRITDYYMEKSRANVLPLAYPDIVNRTQETIVRLAEFLDLQVKGTQIESIKEELSRERVRKYIRKLEEFPTGQSGDHQTTSSATTTVRNRDGTYRVYDYQTGFQSRHITSVKDGEWRKILSAEQQVQLNALTAEWLVRYGYPPG